MLIKKLKDELYRSEFCNLAGEKRAGIPHQCLNPPAGGLRPHQLFVQKVLSLS